MKNNINLKISNELKNIPNLFFLNIEFLLQKNFEPYSEIHTDVLNQRAKIVYKNKSLADKFKHMELDRQLEKEDQTSQDNIFPESKANMFFNFGQSDKIRSFHEKNSWKEN